MMVRSHSYLIAQLSNVHRTDLIFKDQAMSSRDGKGGRFVNDLLRTEFHKCVLDRLPLFSILIDSENSWVSSSRFVQPYLSFTTTLTYQ